MNVAVVAPSPVPFAPGGAERLWWGLTRVLNERTEHAADLVKVPVDERTLPGVVAGYRRFWLLDLSHFDVVVSTKYPAWMTRHADHVVYMQHPLRGLYDLYPPGLPTGTRPEPELAQLELLLGRGALDAAAVEEVFGAFAGALRALGPEHEAFHLPGPLARRLVRFLDRAALTPPAVRRHLAISRTVADREGYFPPGVVAEAVHHPSDLEGLREGRHDYFFTASRLEPSKRVRLVAEAMAHVPRGIPLKIAGSGPEAPALQRLADRDPRVELLGHVGTSQLVDLYANALAVPFVPYDEDLGLITLEAMASGKPVVTAPDAGGPLELVEHGVNGLVAEPDPRAIGAALAALANEPGAARRMGRAAKARAAAVRWEPLLDALFRPAPAVASATAAPVPRVRGPVRRGRVVVVSTFPIHTKAGGGQLRSYHLYRELTRVADVRVVSLTGPAEPLRDVHMEDGFSEAVVPKSAEHEAMEQELLDRVGVPVTDVGASLLVDHTPDYAALLAVAAEGADAVLLAHPYMYPAVRRVAPGLPVVYDAHNVEAELKATVFPDTADGRRLLDVVRRVEGAAVAEASLVVTCSDDDAAAFARVYGVPPERCTTVANGVDLGAVAFTPWAERGGRRDAWLADYAALSGYGPFAHLALFTGSLHVPNVEAARCIMSIAGALPDTLFALVGNHGLVFERWQLPPNVALLGVVGEAVKATLLAAADVALNPMTQGSGTNLKVAEYFAAGVPVVSTPLGARGLAAGDGVHLRLAPVEQFADGVRAVLGDAAGSAAMAERARALAEERYDWRVLGRLLVERLAPVLTASARAARPASAGPAGP